MGAGVSFVLISESLRLPDASLVADNAGEFVQSPLESELVGERLREELPGVVYVLVLLLGLSQVDLSVDAGLALDRGQHAFTNDLLRTRGELEGKVLCLVNDLVHRRRPSPRGALPR